MKKCVIFILFIMVTACFGQKANDIEWNDGMAFRNGKAIYFDPSKLLLPEIYISHDYLTNQKKYYPIFPGGALFWDSDGKGNLAYYSTPVTNNPDYIVDSQKMLHYKISNESIYLTENFTNWEKMEFRLIATNPESQVEFRVYLKSRWFEGEYNIFEP